MTVTNAEEKPIIENQPPKSAKPRRGWWILVGILIILLLAGAGAYFGYQEAMRMRLDKQSSQVALEATTQFQLVQQDIDAKRLAVARQRLDYIIKLDPTFPGAQEKLAEVMYLSSITETPTPAPSPTMTPTVDNRGVEDLYSQARQFMASKDWDKAINELDQLRKVNISYRVYDVDGLYYMALRNRGADKILKTGQLQEGLYDLALAEKFGPLDGDANGYRNWANLYLTGEAYWGVDWQKVVDIYAQIYPSYPGLRDSSGITATERFRQASISLADQQMTASKPCDADKNYKAALQLSNDTQVAQKEANAANACNSANPAPTQVAPTATGVAAPTQPAAAPTQPSANTPAPSNTPVPPEPTQTPLPKVESPTEAPTK
jgi:tetratricopeptide (TPR) repeat protein